MEVDNVYLPRVAFAQGAKYCFRGYLFYGSGGRRGYIVSYIVIDCYYTTAYPSGDLAKIPNSLRVPHMRATHHYRGKKAALLARVL